MRESTVVNEWKADSVRGVLLRQGRKRFGEPTEHDATALAAVTDLHRLERMSDRILDVSSWQELLETL